MNFKPAEIYYGKKNGKDILKEWFVYYYFRHPVTGLFKRFKEKKGINRYHTIKERIEEAQKLREAMNLNLKAGYSPFATLADMNLKTFPEALDYALEKKKGFVDDRTIIEYRSQLKYVKESISSLMLDDTDIMDITRSHIKQVLYKVRDSSSINTYNKYLSALKSMFAVLVEDQLVEVSPVHGIKSEKRPETVGYHSFPAPLKTIIKDLLYKDSFAFGLIGETIYETGIREKEILSLKWGNINYSDLSIIVTGDIAKNDKIREVPLKKSVIEKYRQHFEYCESPPLDWYIFGNKDTLASSPRSFHRNRITERWHEVVHIQGGIDEKFKMYGLKHTGADDKIMSGLPIEYLKDLYGHHSTKMTRIYAKKLQEKAGQIIREQAPDF